MFKLIDNMYNYDHLKHYKEKNDEDDKCGFVKSLKTKVRPIAI